MPTSRVAIIRRLSRPTIDEDAGRIYATARSRAPPPRRASRCRLLVAGCWVVAPAGGALCVVRRPSPRLCGLSPASAGGSACVGRGRALPGASLVVATPMMLAGAVGRSGLRSAAALLEPVAGRGLRPGARRTVDDFDRRAVAQAVDAVDHHFVADLEAGGDHRALAVARSGDDVAFGDRRIVVEEIDEIARCAELDRRVGGERRPGHGVDQKADVDELLREQNAVRIGERRRILIVPVVTSIWLS